MSDLKSDRCTERAARRKAYGCKHLAITAVAAIVALMPRAQATVVIRDTKVARQLIRSAFESIPRNPALVEAALQKHRTLRKIAAKRRTDMSRLRPTMAIDEALYADLVDEQLKIDDSRIMFKDYLTNILERGFTGRMGIARAVDEQTFLRHFSSAGPGISSSEDLPSELQAPMVSIFLTKPGTGLGNSARIDIGAGMANFVITARDGKQNHTKAGMMSLARPFGGTGLSGEVLLARAHGTWTGGMQFFYGAEPSDLGSSPAEADIFEKFGEPTTHPRVAHVAAAADPDLSVICQSIHDHFDSDAFALVLWDGLSQFAPKQTQQHIATFVQQHTAAVFDAVRDSAKGRLQKRERRRKKASKAAPSLREVLLRHARQGDDLKPM